MKFLFRRTSKNGAYLGEGKAEVGIVGWEKWKKIIQRRSGLNRILKEGEAVWTRESKDIPGREVLTKV